MIALGRFHAEQHGQGLTVEKTIQILRQANYGIPGETVGIDVVDGSEEGLVSEFRLFFSK